MALRRSARLSFKVFRRNAGGVPAAVDNFKAQMEAFAAGLKQLKADREQNKAITERVMDDSSSVVGPRFPITYRELQHQLNYKKNISKGLPIGAFFMVPFVGWTAPFIGLAIPSLLPTTLQSAETKAELAAQKNEVRRKAFKAIYDDIECEFDNLVGGRDIITKARKQGLTNDEFLAFTKLMDIDYKDSIFTHVNNFKNMNSTLSQAMTGEKHLLAMDHQAPLVQVLVEDMAMLFDGPEYYTVEELKEYLTSRGANTTDMTEAQVRAQVADWLALYKLMEDGELSAAWVQILPTLKFAHTHFE